MSIVPYLAAAIGFIPVLFSLTNFRDVAPFHNKSHAAKRYFFFLQKVALICGTAAITLVAVTGQRRFETWPEAIAVYYGTPFAIALVTFRWRRIYDIRYDGGLLSYFKVRIEELTPYRFKQKPRPEIPSGTSVSVSDQSEVKYPFGRSRTSTSAIVIGISTVFVFWHSFIYKGPRSHEVFALDIFFTGCLFLALIILLAWLAWPGYITIDREYLTIVNSRFHREHLRWKDIGEFKPTARLGVSVIEVRGNSGTKPLYLLAKNIKGYSFLQTQDILTQWHERYKQGDEQ